MYLSGEIDDQLAVGMCSVLRHIDGLGAKWNSAPPIILFINSPGGEVRAGFAIIDCIRGLESPLVTWVQGAAYSMACYVAMAGIPEGRVVSPHSMLMIHEASGGFWGKHTESLDFKEAMDKEMDLLVNHIAKCTGQRRPTVRRDLKRDHYLTAKEALAYGKKGIADKIFP